MVEEFKPEINGEGLRIGIVKARLMKTSAKACSTPAWPN